MMLFTYVIIRYTTLSIIINQNQNQTSPIAVKKILMLGKWNLLITLKIYILIDCLLTN